MKSMMTNMNNPNMSVEEKCREYNDFVGIERKLGLKPKTKREKPVFDRSLAGMVTGLDEPYHCPCGTVLMNLNTLERHEVSKKHLSNVSI